MDDEIIAADRPWSKTKVAILLDGEALTVERDSAGRETESILSGPSAFEMRTRAYDGFADPDTILDVAQLEMSAREISDPVVRAALLLRIRTMAHEHSIGEYLRDPRGRTGYRLLDRASDLIVRIGRGHHRQLNRSRAGSSEQPVCWRCLTAPVARAGECCEDICNRSTQRPPGAPRKHAEHFERPVALLSDTERQEAIQHLVDTQESGLVPGEEYRRKKEFAYDMREHETVYPRQAPSTTRSIDLRDAGIM